MRIRRVFLFAFFLAFHSFVKAQPDGIQACAACHGTRGEGQPGAGMPRLSGQPAAYLERQLEAYADGRRENKVMTPIAKNLSPEQRRAFADYYAEQTAPASKQPRAEGNVTRGRRLAVIGDDAQRIQACQNCHGPGGIGLLPATPYLAGVDPKYLQSALEAWRSGERLTDPSNAMHALGAHLTDADISALAAYYGGASPPRYAGIAGGGGAASGSGASGTQRSDKK